MSGTVTSRVPQIVFAGTPEFASHILAALLCRHEYSVTAAYTQPDRPAGRGKQLSMSPVKQLAGARSLPVYQPESLRDHGAQDELRMLAPDLMIVAAYGLILPASVLAVPRHGCINVHASLLPRWRGAAPVERAIEAGDQQTGITIMQMDAGLDTGDVLLQQNCDIDATQTGDSLRARLSAIGAEALLRALALLFAGRLQPQAQDAAHASYAPKLRREEALLDWQLDARFLARRVRAFNGANVCQSWLDGQVLRIWEAFAEQATVTAAPGTILSATRDGVRIACGSGVLRLTRLQLPGGRPMDAASMLNGRSDLFLAGKLLGKA